jgi:hypothetical protein
MCLASSQVPGLRPTRRMTTWRASPVSRRPSGLEESPLFRIGLALRLFVMELAVELAIPDFRRVGRMRTMVDGWWSLPWRPICTARGGE